jgi:hypothetical protein
LCGNVPGQLCPTRRIKRRSEKARRGEARDNASYDLQLDTLAVKFDGTYLEVDANSGDERRSPCVVAKT